MPLSSTQRTNLLAGVATVRADAIALGSLPIALGTVTPQQFGAIGDGTSHPLSSKYSSLAAAHVDYPFAVALTDEIDWCAFQSAMNYFLTQNNATASNWSCGNLYVPSGVYVVNREIVSYVFNLSIRSDKAGQPEFPNNPTTLIWNGPAGTVDAPKYIFKSYTIDPGTGQPPVGVLPQPRGTKLHIGGIAFSALSDANAQLPGYVSAIFLGTGTFTKIVDCNFGSVYDGVAIGGSQMFVTIANNSFYGVYRDAISQFTVKGNFSTCLWIRNNDFGFYGRYAILVTSQGIEQKHLIEGNDFEGQSSNSFYFQNKQHFFQGIDADVCLMELAGVFNNNRFETETYRHNLHLIDVFSTVAFNTFSGPADSAALAMSVQGPRTEAFNAYLEANGYSDITDQRNYTFDNAQASNDSLSFYSNVMPGTFVYKYGGNPYNVQTGFSVAMQAQTSIFNIPVVDGTITQDFASREEQAGMYYAPFVMMNSSRAWLYQCIETIHATHNIGLGYEAQDDYGGGQGVIAIGRTSTPPTENPQRSTLLWMDASDNKLKVRSPDGTITVLN